MSSRPDERLPVTLRADHSQLPTGNPPEKIAVFGHLLAEACRDENVETDKAFAVDGARLRASWAGGCSRELGYRIAGTEQSNPTGLSGFWVMGLGTMIHTNLQAVLATAFPGAEIEKQVDWQPTIGLPGASHIDAYVPADKHPDGKSTVIEIKSIGGFAYKLMVGARGPAQGPKMGHLLQAGLSARALGADQVTMLYLAREAMSKREADKIHTDDVGRFLAEWTFPMGALDEMVDREIARLSRILELVDEGKLPPRFMPAEMPSTARVTDPESGAWTLERGGQVLEAGSLWKCGSYCEFRDQCIQDGAS